MIEFNEDIPFLWRLSSHNNEGFCVVSMVVSFPSGEGNKEHTIETNILSLASDVFSAEEEMMEWNEDDISLFLKLISGNNIEKSSLTGQTIKVDLTDPATIEIIHIVAAAGFGLALPSDDVLADSSSSLLGYDCEIGSPISINTLEGYKRCVVVDIEGEDVVCVMLDEVQISSPGQFDAVNPHDLLLLKRHHILHPEYTSQTPTKSDVLH